MKTIQLVVRIEVPDKTSPKRVQKLTEMLLDIGLNDAAETLEMESDGGPPSQNIRDAKAVTDTEIAQYYNEHKDEYRQPELPTLEEKKPSEPEKKPEPKKD